MPDDGNAGTTGQPDESADIASILSATSDIETNGGASEMSSGTQGGNAGAESDAGKQFSFGGRSYKTQKEAEQAHNQLYGKWSQQQGILNQLRGALKNPKTVQALAKDPEWASVLEKMGIEEVQEEMDEEIEEGTQLESMPKPLQSLARQMGMQSAMLSLEREEWNFERNLGRAIKPEERASVYKMIQTVPKLTFEQAWKLANYDNAIKSAREKALAEGRPAKSVSRPSPVSALVPGMKLNLKKDIRDMNQMEYREHLRTSDEFKNLMS